MQKLQLTIPEPCHENWQQMTPTDQGRFCNACAKEVIDFSMMTDTEVLNYFTTLTHDKVCGRALPSQLERTISKSKDPKKRLFWYWNYMVMFCMFFGKGNSVKAQGGIKNTVGVAQTTIADLDKIKSININNALVGKVGEVAVNSTRIVTGKVADKDGNPVLFASIKIKGTAVGVFADAKGVYSINVNPKSILIISNANFKTAEVPVGTTSIINTVLEKTTLELKKEVVITKALCSKRTTRAIKESKPLFVVDGTIMPVKTDISPDDIEDITVLHVAQATTIYGSQASYGAIVITSRKAKEIKMKEVVVTSGTMMGGIRNVTTSETTIIEKCEKLVDTVKTFVTNLTGTIKVYPNPAQRGNEINISLKLKQTGLYQIQITDASGRIILQKQINAHAKESTEKILADARWSGGMYYISIIDAQNKLVCKSSFIVQ